MSLHVDNIVESPVLCVGGDGCGEWVSEREDAGCRGGVKGVNGELLECEGDADAGYESDEQVTVLASTEDGGDPTATDDSQLTLLDRLDRRQNEVLLELDRLNESIDQLVQQLRDNRGPAAVESFSTIQGT